MQITERSKSSDEYRYGFNGMEKDDEVNGSGNSYDFGARLFNARVGRWYSTDRVANPWISPYQFASNNPVNNVDPDGNDEIHFHYYLRNALDEKGRGVQELTYSVEIIKNDKEHTFFMHFRDNKDAIEFHPFDAKLPNQSSYVAHDLDYPLSYGVDWLVFESKLDDHAYLGRLLQVVPEVMEHYSNAKDGTGVRFKGALNRAGSIDFAQKMITGTETVYAIIDGFILLKGLSKFAVKELAKSSLKIAESNINTVVKSTTRVKFDPTTLYAKYGERHIFSPKHIKNGILELGGKNGQIDHPIPVQIDHLFRLKLTTQFRSKLTT